MLLFFRESKTMLDFSEITDQDDTRYILNGKKNCVVNAKDADLFVVTAKHAGSTKVRYLLNNEMFNY